MLSISEEKMRAIEAEMSRFEEEISAVSSIPCDDVSRSSGFPNNSTLPPPPNPPLKPPPNPPIVNLSSPSIANSPFASDSAGRECAQFSGSAAPRGPPRPFSGFIPPQLRHVAPPQWRSLPGTVSDSSSSMATSRPFMHHPNSSFPPAPRPSEPRMAPPPWSSSSGPHTRPNLRESEKGSSVLKSLTSKAVVSSAQVMYSSPPVLHRPSMSALQASNDVDHSESVWEEKVDDSMEIEEDAKAGDIEVCTDGKMAKNKGRKMKKFLRIAAGEIWEDTSLADWDPDDYRIFCGDLGNEVTDEILARAFNKYPSFQRAKIIRNKRSRKTKGYGFVSFKDADDFARAMREMNGKYVGNRPIKLKKSEWKNRQVDVFKKKMKERKKFGLR